MLRQDVADRHGKLLQELNEERVAALTRISRTLEALLAQLQVSRERLDELHGEERAAEAAHYREVRERARTYRWYLEVQREALGIRHHHRLDEFYKVPPAIEL